MLIQGDFDLNSAQRYADSTKEVLKQTILDQEIIFRKQVHELHRLYGIQKTLMENLSWKELESYDSWKASTQSNLVGSTQFINQDLLEEHQGVCSELQPRHSSLQKRPFDLQLPADQYISSIDMDLPEKGKSWDSLKESLGDKSSFLGNNVSNPEFLKLSLCIGEDTSKKGGGSRNRYSEKTFSCAQYVIDLEESTEKGSDEDTQTVSPLIFAGLTPSSGDKHELQASVLSNLATSKSGKKDPEDGTMMSCSIVDGSESYQEQTCFHQGLNESYGDVRSNNLFTKKQQFTSYVAGQMDLNRIQFEDSSCYSNDVVVPYPSTASSSGILHGLDGQFEEGGCPTMTCWRKPNADSLNENSDTLPTLTDSNNKSNSTEILPTSAKSNGSNGSELCPIDLESVSGPALDLCEDPGRCCSNTQNEVDLPLEPPTGLLHDGEDTVFSFPYRSHSTVQDGNCKSDCIADNNSSSIKTMLSRVELGGSNLSTFDELPKSQIWSQVAETPFSEQDSSESKHQCHTKKDEESDVNALVQKAAESLIHISLESSACYQECFTNKGSHERENDKREQPQYSSDSFESITLKLMESSADDYSVSSIPFEVNGSEEKDFGFKLRRGRRMKDFQRDILPGLATLTRHEICEDINILDGVIRSREYRKMRSKMGNGENFCTPLRSRRPRRNYGGRRNHL